MTAAVAAGLLVVSALPDVAGGGSVVSAAPVDPAAAAERSLVQFVPGLDRAAVEATLLDHGVIATRVIDGSSLVAVVERSVDELGALEADARVAHVEADVVLVDPVDDAVSSVEVESGAAMGSATASEAAVQRVAPWHLDRIDQIALPFDQGFDTALTGRGVTAYVLDSGIRGDHVEFGGRVQPGFSIYGDDGRIDCRSHGTHVASTIGGAVYGVAKQVTLVPVRASQCDGQYFTSDIVAALAWVRSHHQNSVPAVLNLSVAGPITASLDQTVRDTVADGVVVVVAAGNYADLACRYSPAREPLAITVAAVDETDYSPEWSNYGSCVDIFAPGVRIVAATNTSSTATESKDGTSMAAPVVVGAIALLLEREPTLTPAQVTDRLLTSAVAGVVDNEGTGSPNRLLHVPSAGYVPLTPARLMDSRPDGVTIDGVAQRVGLVKAGETFELQVTGRGGVPSTAGAVVLNVTAVGGPASGFLTVFPCGSARPNSSNLNFSAREVIPNAVVSKIDGTGRVCVFSNAAAQVIVDVNGYVPGGGSYVGLTPARLMDTRVGGATADGQFVGLGTLGAGGSTMLQVSGRGGVPVDAEAAVLNVTAVAGASAGFVTVYPCGVDRPNSSSLNYAAGATIPNAVITSIGAAGRVCVFTSAPADLIVDVAGYFPAGSSYVAMNPARLMDTRPDGSTADGQVQRGGIRSAGQVTELVVEGRASIPTVATAVVLNVTVTDPVAAGFVTVFPCGEAVPNSSNLNFSVGQTIPNAVIAKIGAGGAVCLFTQASTHLVVDVGGYLME